MLQFLYEHSFDKQLYCVLPSEAGELQLTWRADAPAHWEIVCTGEDAPRQVPRASLLKHLAEQGADMHAFERELYAVAAAHVVVADQLLTAAHRALGSDGVKTILHGQERFVRELQQALTHVLTPRLRLVR
ncbi:MAG TPA: hypothetical protein VI299_08595 [Polyangiales bacterium]